MIKKVNVLFPEKIVEQLKVRALKENRIYNALICHAVLKYLNIDDSLMAEIEPIYNPVGRPRKKVSK